MDDFIAFHSYEKSNKKTIKIMTYNVRLFNLYNWIPELNKQNLPFGFKVNAWKEVPENNPQDWVYKTTNPGDMYGSIADQFTPEVFKDYVLKSSDTGATLFGGCCEIKPKHIKALKNLFY